MSCVTRHILVLLVLVAGTAAAQESARPEDAPEVGVVEKLGERVPLDLLFNDSERNEVRLGDLFLNQPKRKFDLVLLGIGADGHTASLFPGTEALNEAERWVVANEVPRLEAWRLTMTFRALNAARGRLTVKVFRRSSATIHDARRSAPNAPAPGGRSTAGPSLEQRSVSASPGMIAALAPSSSTKGLSEQRSRTTARSASLNSRVHSSTWLRVSRITWVPPSRV